MKIFLTLFVLLFFAGCTTTDEGILCETGPVGLTFEIVIAGTGENIFSSGLYKPDQLHIENQVGEKVRYRFYPERNVIDVVLGWESKSGVYTVTFNEEIEFKIVFTLVRSGSNGCTSTQLAELEIDGANYELNKTNGLLSIFVN